MKQGSISTPSPAQRVGLYVSRVAAFYIFLAAVPFQSVLACRMRLQAFILHSYCHAGSSRKSTMLHVYL
jgi:hypothetical protein